MATSYTTLLGLALPVQGELQGTWGDEVNNYITNYLDAAVAGTQNISTDADVTLTKTTGTALTGTSSQYSILLFSGSRAAQRTVTVPAASKSYVVINATTGGFAVKVVGVGPTTGVTIAAGEKAVIAWDGSDFVRVAAYGGTGEFTTVDTTNLEVTNVKAKDGTSAATIADSTGVVSFTANPVLSGGTANGVLYLNGSKVATSGTDLVFNATGLGIGTSSPSQKLHVVGSVSTGLFEGSTLGGITLQKTGTNGVQLFSDAAGVLKVYNNQTGVTAATIDSSGKVGIGTSSPSGKLDVTGSVGTVRVETTGNKISFTRNGANYISAAGGSSVSLNYDAPVHNFNSGDGATTRMTLNDSGNLGLGVTPSAWDASWKAFEQVGGSVWSFNFQNISLTQNAYHNGTNYIYKNSSAATDYQQSNGSHLWKIAPSGTAGNAISFTQAMTLDASGRLLVATTSSTGANTKLVVGSGLASSNGIAVINTANQNVNGIFISNWDGTTTTQGPRIGFDNSGRGAFTIGCSDGANNFDICQTWGTPLARITSGGELLVGDTSNTTGNPKLYVNGAVSLTGGNSIYWDGTLRQPTFTIDYDGSLDRLTIGSSANTSNTVGSYIRFLTGPSNAYAERARITSGGDLLVGTTSAGFQNNLSVTVQGPSGYVICNHVNGTGSGAVYAGFGYNGSGIGSITQDGTTAVLFNTTSDRRLKQNIAPAPSASDVIDAIQIVSHDWKSAPDEHVTYGVIAQDLHAVAPQAVSVGDAGDEIEKAWGVDYSKLVPMLIKEIQSLRARVAALETN